MNHLANFRMDVNIETSVHLKPSDVENTTDSLHENSDQEKHPCDFCGTLAKFVCHFCTYKYCQCCREKLHPLVGPFRHHDVAFVDDVNSFEYFDQCDEHGLPEKLLCDFCKNMKCVECASSKCKLHFRNKISDVDIEIEKRKVFKQFERASSKLSFLGKYRNQLEEEALNLELNTMLKKEKVRQEFVSFHEMLIVKENAVLEKIDKEMDARLRYIRGTLLAQVEKLEEEDSSLTSIVVDLIQTEDEEHFIQDHVSAKERPDKPLLQLLLLLTPVNAQSAGRLSGTDSLKVDPVLLCATTKKRRTRDTNIYNWMPDSGGVL